MRILIVRDKKWSLMSDLLSQHLSIEGNEVEVTTHNHISFEKFYDLCILDELYFKELMCFSSAYEPVKQHPFFVILNDGSCYLELKKKSNYLGYLDFDSNLTAIASLIHVFFEQGKCESRSVLETAIPSCLNPISHEILETFPIGIVIQNPTGNITDMNTAAELILEATKSQLTGVTSMDPRWQTVDINGRPLIGEDHPAMVTIRTLEKVDNFIMGVYSLKQSSFKWIRVYSVPIFDEMGAFKLVYTCFIDATEEINYSQRHKVFSSVFEYSPISMLVTNREGIIESVNPKLIELTGYQESDLIQKNVSMFAHEASTTNYKGLWDTITEGRVWRGEFTNKNKKGELYIEESVIAPIKNSSGEITHFVALKDDVTQLRKVKNDLEHTLENLENLVEKRTKSLLEAQTTTLESLSALSEFRDNETGMHIQRTKLFMKLILEQLEDQGKLEEQEVYQMWNSGALHDIGKVAIRDNILLKPGKLTEDEFEIMKEHVRFGHQALTRATELLGIEDDYLKYAKEITLCHHEKWDGSGYPNGVKGEAIPLSARVMAIVDVYDALRSKRPYKEPYSHSVAMDIIQKEKGKHFDPDLLDIFLSVGEEIDVLFEILKDQ